MNTNTIQSISEGTAQTATPTTKISVVLRDDLKSWQALNVTAFLVSGIAATVPGSVGLPYLDGSDISYLPMFGQPVMIFAAEKSTISHVLRRALDREVTPALYTEELFATGNDVDNRAAVRAVQHEALNVVGLAFRCDRKVADKILKGLTLHP